MFSKDEAMERLMFWIASAGASVLAQRAKVWSFMFGRSRIGSAVDFDCCGRIWLYCVI